MPRRQLKAEYAEIPEFHLRSVHSTQKQKSASFSAHDGIQYITNKKIKTLRRGKISDEVFCPFLNFLPSYAQVVQLTSGKRYFA